MQFDRARRERREQQHAAEMGAGGGPAGQQAERSASAPGSPAAVAAEPVGPSSASPRAAEEAASAGGSAAGVASGEAGAASEPGPAPTAVTDSWDDSLYASGSSDDEDEDAAAAAAGAAASSGIDVRYAAALEAAAEGSSSAEEAAAAPGAPSLDGMAAAVQQQQEERKQQQQQQQRQPSLWHAFEGGRRMLQVGLPSLGCRWLGHLAAHACCSLLGPMALLLHLLALGTLYLSNAAAAQHRLSTFRRDLQRFVGQCNLQTDIKEACFLGADDGLVAAGSDDGRVFVFRTSDGECIRQDRVWVVGFIWRWR